MLIPINQDGSKGMPEKRQRIKVKSQNYRIELGQATHRSYPPTGRPIGVFLEIDDKKFQYRIYMPVDAEYTKLKELLDVFWNGPARQVRRVQISMTDFLRHVPSVRL